MADNGLQTCSLADVTLRVRATATGVAEDYCDVIAYGGLRQWTLLPTPVVDYSPSWILTGSPALTGPGLLAFAVYQGPSGTPGLYYLGTANGWVPGAGGVWQERSAYYGSEYAEAMPEAAAVAANGTLVAAFVDGALDCELRFTTTHESGLGVARAYCDEALLEEYSTANPVELATLVSKLWLVTGGQQATAWPNPAIAIEESMRVSAVEATVWDTDGAPSAEAVVVNGSAPATVTDALRDWEDWKQSWAPDGNANNYRAFGDLFHLADTEITGGQARWEVDAEGYVYAAGDDSEPYSAAGENPGLLVLYGYAYAIGVPNLSLIHHPVSNTLLVGDAGLVEQAGHHKLQRKADSYEWSERQAAGDLTGAASVNWANLVVTGARTDLSLGTAGQAQVAKGASLDAAWGTPATVVSEDAPWALAAQGRLYLGTVSVGKARLTVRALGDEYDAVEDAVEIGDAAAVPPVLALHPTLKRLYAAVQQAGDTVLHVSDDQGATWREARTVAGLQYPNLFVEGNRLWLVGYVAGVYQGARGQVWAQAYETDAAVTALGSAVTVGPGDAGRPAVIRRPATGELIVVAPKTSPFWEADPAYSGAGIAEYHSVDSGATWSFKAVHQVA